MAPSLLTATCARPAAARGGATTETVDASTYVAATTSTSVEGKAVENFTCFEECSSVQQSIFLTRAFVSPPPRRAGSKIDRGSILHASSARFKTRGPACGERKRTFKFFERRNPLPVIVSVVPPSFGPALGAIALSTGGAASGKGWVASVVTREIVPLLPWNGRKKASAHLGTRRKRRSRSLEARTRRTIGSRGRPAGEAPSAWSVPQHLTRASFALAKKLKRMAKVASRE